MWWNDPSAIPIICSLADFQFHATVIYASGGVLLSGDDLTKIAPDRLAMLKKLLPPTGRAAEFADDSLRVGVVNLPGARVVCVFNWEDRPQTISVPLPRPSRVTDFWSGEDLGRREGSLEIKDLPPQPGHSGRRSRMRLDHSLRGHFFAAWAGQARDRAALQPGLSRRHHHVKGISSA